MDRSFANKFSANRGSAKVILILLVGLLVLVGGVWFMFSGGSESGGGSGRDSIGVDSQAELEAEQEADRREEELARREREDARRQKRREAMEAAEAEAKAEADGRSGDISIEDLEAERLYTFAQTQFKIGSKMGMTFKQTVDTCREIIRRFPDSEFSFKARELMKQIPERHRSKYNITDGELGL